MLGCLAQLALGQAAPDSKLTPETRVSIAAKMYALVEVHFGNRKGASDPALDASHQGYLHAVLASEDRREFDLGTMEFLAELHNGHTLFLDSWLNEHYGQPLGFFAAPIEGKWVVQVSFVPGLKPGDVIAAIDGVPMEEFFQRHEKYISASSARARRHNLFLLPYLFPIEFTLRLEDGRSVAINRATAKEQQAKPEARWLKQGDTAHIRIPAFYPPGEDVALDFLRQYQKAKALILDLRNNPGGVPPVRLIRALMDRPYRSWKESVPLRIALFDAVPQAEKPAEASSMSDYARGYHDALANLADNAQITRGGDSVAPAPGAFRGRLVLLVDGGCVSACEDFVMPFKDNGRARLVGETTQGTAGLPYTHDFHNGMVVRIAVKRLSFPDGSEFEGMGIKPDVEVHTSIEMLRQGRDAALAKALELVNQR
jgi:carboxyl-terminal processing protease